MNDWSAGYVTAVPYTFGYYPELNPLRARLALSMAGIVPPAMNHACELGFGQGVSLNLHAAAGGEWFGTDFNPAQVGVARELAQASGAKVEVADLPFAEFCRRDDLPEFDFIGVHGIWSWISEDNRRVLVDFFSRRLKTGGVLYISYNTLPGWSAFAPLRHLMARWRRSQAPQGWPLPRQIEGAIEFIDRLIALDPAFARVNPLVRKRLDALKTQDRHYLAHEYFNADWHLTYFHDMADVLSAARLEYAVSAHCLDWVPAINLTPEQQRLLAEIDDPILREGVRDFCVNQQFRRDYWVKGVRRFDPLTQATRLREIRVVLIRPIQAIELKVAGALGEAKLDEAVYRPLLDALGSHKPQTLGQLERTLRGRVPFASLLQAVPILIGMGALAPAQEDTAISRARKRTDRLNRHLMARAKGSAEIAYLASPVTGGGIAVGRIDQLFLLFHSEGRRQPEALAESVWQLLATQGQKLVKDGRALETEEENLSELRRQAGSFLESRLPLYQALQLI